MVTIEEQLSESLARKIRHCDEIMEERDKAMRERDEAQEKADVYLHDWYAAKVDFGTAMGKMREALRAAEKRELEALAELDEARSAFTRGAEEMRLACQEWCRAWENDGEAIADALADLRVGEP